MLAHKESRRVNGISPIGVVIVDKAYSRARLGSQSRSRWIAEGDSERLWAFQVGIVDDDHGDGLDGFSGSESDCANSGFVITARRSHPIGYVTIQSSRRIAGCKANAGCPAGVAATSDGDVNSRGDFSASV